MSWALELLGEPAQATQRSDDAVALASRLDYPFSYTQALVFATFLQRERGDWQMTQQLAEDACVIARERGFVQLHARARVMRGWAMVHAGDIEDGINQMQEGIAAIGRSAQHS